MWKSGKYHLDRMTLGELTVAYFQYPAIRVYIALLVIASFFTFHLEAPEIGHPTLSVFLAVVAALLVYPLVWYLLHRFVLHGRFLYRSPIPARLWKRIHYDHPQDPNDLRVLFGALQTTL